MFKAKKLAIAREDTGGVPEVSDAQRISRISNARRGELSWTLARTPAEKAFVNACFSLVDSSKIPRPPDEPRELRRCLISFADLQTITSNSIFLRSKTPPFLRLHKRRLRRIYLDIVAESYTVMPSVVGRYLGTPRVFSNESRSLFSYLTLHLIQLNAFGQIYPDSLFDNFGRFMRDLAYAGVIDMEDYAEYRDEYLTAVKSLPPEYGTTARRNGFELDYGTAPSPAEAARRKAENLLPLDMVSPAK